MLDNAIIFDSRIAEKYSLEEAIVIAKLYGWIKHNATNGKNYHDGRYWTFNSLSAFAKYFPFWSESKVKRVLIDLYGGKDKKDAKPKHEQILLKGWYNKSSFDRTIWYSFTDEFFAYLNKLGYELKAEEPFSACDQMDMPLDDEQYQINNTENNKEKENSQKKADISESVVGFWNEKADNVYPRVRKITDRTKKAIKARLNAGYSFEDIKKAILLMNSLSSFYKGQGENAWRADFHWLIENVNGNFDKILEGSLHTKPNQQQAYREIMGLAYESPKQQKTISPYEKIDEQGNRYYLQGYGKHKVIIPPDALPRPSETMFWSNFTKSWYQP